MLDPDPYPDPQHWFFVAQLWFGRKALPGDFKPDF
jgi:hypothetical protein